MFSIWVRFRVSITSYVFWFNALSQFVVHSHIKLVAVGVIWRRISPLHNCWKKSLFHDIYRRYQRLRGYTGWISTWCNGLSQDCPRYRELYKQYQSEGENICLVNPDECALFVNSCSYTYSTCFLLLSHLTVLFFTQADLIQNTLCALRFICEKRVKKIFHF